MGGDGSGKILLPLGGFWGKLTAPLVYDLGPPEG